MTEKELMHYGIPGMRWGVRRFRQRLEERKVRKNARKDAMMYAEAKMDFGKGAGIKRRHVKAALDVKFRDKNYKKAFDDALAQTNYRVATKKAKTAHDVRAAKEQAVRSTKMVANFLTGTSSLAAAYILYANNKPAVDNFIRKQFKKRVR